MLQFKYNEYLFDFYGYIKAKALSIFFYEYTVVNFDERIVMLDKFFIWIKSN